jgi:hypothetical protein
MLEHPLPPVGVRYKTAWGDEYDYYGNRVEQKNRQGVGGSYNESLDNIYNEWMDLIFFGFFKHHRTIPNDESDHYNDTRFKESEVAKADQIFSGMYGGFGFDAIMTMITQNPSFFRDAVDLEFDKWVDNLYGEFFERFCRENDILPVQIPDKSLESMHDLFYRHAHGGVVVRDWPGVYLNYVIGIEMENGEFYEMRASEILSDWIIGHLVKDFVGLAVGLQHGMDAWAKGRKVGFFEKLIFGEKIKRRKRLMGWTLHPRKVEKASLNIMDVARFYPPPPGVPVANPLL